MVPEKLVIQGVYSYQKRIEIDFTKLTSAGIFGIFGAVGSGKSTILEAISYALFGETERLNKKEGQIYNMMNLRSEELYIDFIFSHNQEKYRFLVKAKRKKKKFEEIDKTERNAYKWYNNEWQALEKNNAEDILELKYEHFKQIVIIPQGKFSEFVHLTPKLRMDMLKELFPIDKYDLSKHFNAMKTENDLAISNLSGRLQELALYTTEHRKEQEEMLEKFKADLQERERKLSEKDKQLKEEEAIREMFLEKNDIEKKYKTLSKNQDYFQDMEKSIEEYEKVRLNYSALFEMIDELKNNSANLKKKYDLQSKELTINEKQLAVNIEKQKEIIKQYGDTATQKEICNQIDKALKIIELNAEHAAKTATKESKENVLLVKKSAYQKIKDELTKKKDVLREKRDSIPDESTLFELKSSYESEDHCRKNIVKADRELKLCNSNLEELNNRRDLVFEELAKSVQAAINWKELPDNIILENINIEEKNTLETIQNIEKENIRLTQLSGLSKYAESLEDGKPCPLCGSEKHPHPYSNSELSDLLKKENERLKNEKTIRDALRKAESEINGLSKEFKQNAKAEDLRKSELDSAQTELDELLAKRQSISIKLNKDELAQALKNLEETKKKIKILEKDIAKDEKLLDNRVEIDRLNDEVNNLKSEIVAIAALINDRKKEVSAEWLGFNTEELLSNKKSIETSISNLENLIKEKIELENIKIKINTELGTLAERIEENKDKFELKQSELQTQLIQDSYENESQIYKILAKKYDVVQEKKKIDKFKQEIFTLKNKLDDLNDRLKETVFDETSFKNLKVEITELKMIIDKLKENIGGIQEKIITIKQKLIDKEKTEKEYGLLENRQRNIKTLVEIFRGDAFMNYVSRIYIEQLCSIANERFKKLTQNQLQLEIDESYNFIVRDFLNNGRVRLLKTLSGGQTFQAALCLALALSEQIQIHQNIKQQFFFMDEGFGSLDKDSLYLVFDSLKQLRKENRIVGIISHLEELKAEMDYYILVEKAEQEGSAITLVG